MAFEDGGLLCLGPSGSGKSTLAECLCRTTDASLLADDIAALERVDDSWRVVPSEAAHWLATSGSTGKLARPTLRVAGNPVSVRWIVALGFVDPADARGPVVRPLKHADAVAQLLGGLLRFEATRDVWVDELDVISALTPTATAYEMTRSRDTAVETAAAALVAALKGSP